MTSFFSLTKAFIESLSMSNTRGFKKVAFTFLLIVVFFFIFLPFILGTGILTYAMTENLMEVNYESVGINLLIILLSLFVFIFSFNVILNELYFNDNIEHILPLPIKPETIVASKFTSCFIAENIMSFFIILSGVLGYLFAIGFKWSSFILSLIGVITLPIIPMIYTGIICLLIMNFTKFIKNKESVRQFSMMLVFIVLFIFVFSISTLRQFDFDLFIENITIGNQSFLKTLNIIFPHINLFIDTINNNSIISLILYLLVNAIFIFIYLLLSKYLYLDGVIGLNSKDTSVKKTSTKLIDNIKKRDPMTSYIIKEFKVLFRTPSFFINCIIINIIWPIFVYAIIKIINLGTLKQLGSLINYLDTEPVIIYFIFILGISIMVPCISTISSSSFSREGKHYDFIKYIPFPLYKVLYSKIFVSFIISFVGIFVYFIIFSIIAHLDILIVIPSLIIITLAIFFISLLGVFIDSIQPKLVWDDELNALRENYNTFVVMGISLLLFGILMIIGFYLIRIDIVNFNLYYIIIVITLSFLIILMLILFRLFGVNNLKEQEEL